ncbi:hypothetical protein [uncultured Comamonas sp.]|uniref:hypothetical protein n=1 Tax=uncultured Comamonas sp. TaxID=114710 RepID=UPI002594519C|nr:hypothetical protein [uncultured Comamonas sp.]
MNIKQALERLEAIADAKKKADNLNTVINRRDSKAPKGVIAQVYPGGQYSDHSGLYCVIDADLLQDAINKTAERYVAEAAKLQPVIDMAEAALKGILATGDTK